MSKTFAGVLRRLMARRKIDAFEVATMAGVSRSTVSTWLTGPLHIPPPVIAARLAKALDAPYLAMAAHEERARTCAFCGQVFEALNRRSIARFCSTECGKRWWHVERKRRTVENRHDHLIMLRNQVEGLLAEKARMREAFALHCARCEPDGVCHDGSCECREFSPFILVERRFA